MSELPRVILRARRAQPFFFRHPWVFAGAIDRIEGDAQPGAEVAVHSDKKAFIGYGLFNDISNIRVRMYSWDAAQRLDDAFWQARIVDAVRLRINLLKLAGPETACRLVFSEADSLSGLTVDRYGDWLLVQFTSLALYARRDVLLAALQAAVSPAGIWLRTEKGILKAEGLEVADGLLSGKEPPRPIFISEHGLRFGIDVVEGQKTGFFLDQRDNRATLAPFVQDKRVLDMFCYSGAFSLTAAKHGAKQVLGIDVSAPAMKLAAANAELNGLSHKVTFQQGDGFKTLEGLRDAGEKFDVVVLDPPKMARHARALPEALKGYHSLNRLALEVLAPDGLLVTCSCTGHVEREQFENMLSQAAVSANRRLQVLASRGAATDHPTSVHCPETNYLKCYFCRVN